MRMGAVFSVAILVGLIWGLISLDASAKERLPYEYFAKTADYHDVKISPDGKYFGVRFNQDDRAVLAFIRREDMKMTAGARPLRDGQIESFRWMNDERVTYNISVQDSYLDYPISDGNLYAVNRDGDKHEILYGAEAAKENIPSLTLSQRRNTYAAYDIISRLPDDDQHILLAEYPYREVGRIWSLDTRARTRIQKLNIYSGRKRKQGLLPIPFANALADRNGEVRIAVGSDEQADQDVYWKPDADGEWQQFDMTKSGVQYAIPLGFSADNQTMFVSAEPQTGGPRAVFKLNLADNSNELVYQNAVANTTVNTRDMDDDSVVMLYSQPGLPHYEYLNEDTSNTARLHKSLRQAFAGMDVVFTSHTDDGEEVIVYVYNSTSPGEYFLFNTKTNKAKFLFARKSWVEPSRMRSMQPITVTARDGMELPGYLTLPETADDTPLPLVIHVHGGPHGARDWWGYDTDTQFLANRGYAVLQLNYRGSGGYGPDFEQAGHGEWGGKMQDDLTDATRWAIEQGHADPDRICIYGASYGGYAALMGVAKEPDLYQCAIGYVGVYDLQTMFDKGDIPDKRSGLGYLRKVLGTDQAKLDAHSPAKLADKIKANVLLAHGGSDERVPVAHANMMREALNTAGNPPEWLVYDAEGHGFYDVDHRIELYKRMEAFLDKHIGADAVVAETVAAAGDSDNESAAVGQ